MSVIAKKARAEVTVPLAEVCARWLSLCPIPVHASHKSSFYKLLKILPLAPKIKHSPFCARIGFWRGTGPESPQQNLKDPVGYTEAGPRILQRQGGKLLPQGQVLQEKIAPASQDSGCQYHKMLQKPRHG